MNRTVFFSCIYNVLLVGFFSGSIFSVLQSDLAADELVASSAPLEPKIASASSEGATQIGTFKIPKKWKCEVFASEPDVANPVVLTIDNSGRVFVCESFRQNQGVTDNRKHDDTWLLADLASNTVEDRVAYHRKLLGDKSKSYEEQDDRIRLLIDENGDGVCDRSTIFASGFNGIEEGTGAGVLVRGENVYYTNIPKLWLLKDSNGDGVAEEKKSLANGFGVRVAFRGHDMHGLVMGPDGRLYFSIGDRGYHVQTPNGLLANPESGAVFRCELDGSNLEIFATGLRNPQELAFDDFGNLFTGDNNSDSGDKARWVYVVPGADSGWRMMYQYLSDRGPFNREKIWYPYDKDSTPAYIVPPIANFSDGPSGLTYYPGTGLDDSYRGTFFLVDFRGGPSNSGVRTLKNKPNGAFFEIAESAQPIWNMLATDIDFGPDGSLFVSDWVNGWDGEGKGRIYRIFDADSMKQPAAIEAKKLLNGDFKKLSEDTLVGLLNHADRRIRAEAQWELASRASLVALSKIALDIQQSDLARVHAIWGLGQLARQEATANAALQAVVSVQLLKGITPPEVSVACLKVIGESHRIIEQGKVKDIESLNGVVLAGLSHSNARVKVASAIAASQLHSPNVVSLLVSILEQNNNSDPIIRHACIMALASQGSAKAVADLAKNSSEAVRLAATVALRRMESSEIETFLADPSDRVALEAARAINDVVALHGSLPKLASSLSKRSKDRAYTQRALNANFRLGAIEHAEALASFAADATQSKAMRIEALDMLSNWRNPKPLDRIMNRYDPLPERDAAIAASAFSKVIEALLKQSNLDSEIRSKTLGTAAVLELRVIAPAIVNLILDKNAPGKDRASAIQWLVKLDLDAAKELLEKLSNDESPEVRVEATRQLVSIAPERSVEALAKLTQSNVMFERQSAWDTLASIKSPTATTLIEKGINRWLAGSLPLDTALNLREAAQGRVDNKKMESFLAKLEATKVEPANPTLAFSSTSSIKNQYMDSLLGGNVANGKQLFETRSQLSCVRCHRVSEKGGEVGPVLSDIGLKKSSEYLLEAIVDPNATIAQGFETMIVQTDEGQIVSGIVKSEDDEKLTLVTATNGIVVVEKDSIEGVKKGQSSMPVDLMKYMTRRELRDLIAYLSSLDGKNLGGDATGHAIE